MSHAQQAVKLPVTERVVAPSPVVGEGRAPEAPPYLMAALVSLGALILYVVTLAPTTQFWDTSEYIAAAYVLGIPHPPGNPLFVLIAHVWGLLPLAAGYAMRINLLAAVTRAIAAGCWFLVSERWMRALGPAQLPRRPAEARRGAVPRRPGVCVAAGAQLGLRARRAAGRGRGRLGLHVPAHPRGALPPDQRRGADHAASAVGCAHAPAIRQATGVGAPGDSLGAARDVGAILQLAMGA